MTAAPRPPDDVVRDREAAYREVESRLRPWLRDDGLRVSPLGPGFSGDVDAYLTQEPDQSALEAAGWIRMDELMRALGYRDQGHWAVLVDRRVVGHADVHLSLPPDRVERLLDRCRRRGAGPRELAEREALQELGHEVGPLPRRRPSARPRRAAGAVRRAARPRVVVAISGVDGAGKSTLTQRLVDDLGKAGVPATRIWARPGTGVLAPVEKLARMVRRVLRESHGWRRAAAGEVSQVRSRRGLVGRVWRAMILVSFLVDIRREFTSARGVVVFDRHLPDAAVTLHVLYPGQNPRLTRRLLQWGLPRAHLRYYLEVPADVALARKPGQSVGEWAVNRQLEEYDAWLDSGVVTLDGREDPGELVLHVLRRLAQGPLG